MNNRIVHVITGLETGGAELMLLSLLRGMGGERFDPLVVSLTETGPVAEQIAALGVPVRALGARRGKPDPLMVPRLARLLRQERPLLVQAWLYHANLVGSLAARAAGNPPVVWGIHHNNLDPAVNKRSTLLIAKAGARLSRRLPAAIVCCAEAARQTHVDYGYAPEKMVVIPNGFDLGVFRPDPEARDAVRQELGLSPSARLVGLVARWDPQKDHEAFIRAAGVLHRQADLPDLHFVLCGGGVTWENEHLVRWIDEEGVRDRCHLLGRRPDVARMQASFDVACLSSHGEAFPLAVGEAMACGVPCAVADVGDAALIVGETGRVVPPRSPAALAAACHALLALPDDERRALGMVARRRIAEHYSLARVTEEYAALWERLSTEPRHR